ncbi:MAG: serine/threonine protein kinase, partial [Kofleriaceae bacterium]|nr:serine/threonine protein kinase [Kofleriaceae bacterium]
MQPGAVIDQRFELERSVAAGGMGQIWRARDRVTGRPVAIKVMLGDDATAHARFGREAALLADLRHPGVVEYVAHGSYAGAPYLAMEWLDGVDLAARSRASRIDAFATVEMRPTQPGVGGFDGGDDDGAPPVGLPVAEVVVLARRLASALGEVHGRGVVHRDLKPENVFLLDGDLTRAKLIDFGVARGAEVAALTADGVVIGTPHYMAPEQVRGDVVTAATDVWGLGAVLYELFA